MKKVLLTALMTGVLASSAWAEVQIKELLVRKKGPDVNVRVNLENPGGPTARSPKITLFIRPDSSSPWKQIKVWNNIAKIGAGEKVARDFFEENNAELRKLAENPNFEVRAVVASKGTKDISKVTVFGDSETGK